MVNLTSQIEKLRETFPAPSPSGKCVVCERTLLAIAVLDGGIVFVDEVILGELNGDRRRAQKGQTL